MKTIKKHINSQGFNLIEIVIAMSIMAFVLISLYTLFIRGTGDIDYAKRQSRATSLAQDKMEELRAAAFARNYINEQLLEGTHRDTIEINKAEFVREWTIENIEYEKDSDGNPITDKPTVKRITIKIDWKGRHSTKTYEISNRRRRF